MENAVSEIHLTQPSPPAERGSGGARMSEDEQFGNLAKWADEKAVSLPQPTPPVPADSAAAAGAVPDTPAAWFTAKFPKLEAKHGQAVEEAFPDKGPPFVKDVSEDFLAATLGEDGAPLSP